MEVYLHNTGLGATDTLDWALSLEARELYTRSLMPCGTALAVARVLISGPKAPFFNPAHLSYIIILYMSINLSTV